MIIVIIIVDIIIKGQKERKKRKKKSYVQRQRFIDKYKAKYASIINTSNNNSSNNNNLIDSASPTVGTAAAVANISNTNTIDITFGDNESGMRLLSCTDVSTFQATWKDIVCTSYGYETFMNHLEKEFSIENLLFISEYMQINK